MEGLKPPQPLSFERNLSENWKKNIQKYDIFIKASGLNKKDPEVQVNVFLHAVGEEGIEKFNTFDLSAEDKNDVTKVIEAFENFCLQKSNESLDRPIFFARIQEEGEKFVDFLTSLKKIE